MNVNLFLLSAGALFFMGTNVFAQKAKKDSTQIKSIEEIVVLGYSKTATKAKSTAASTTISSSAIKIGLMYPF